MIRVVVGVCSECLFPHGEELNVADCAECGSDDPLEINLVVTGPGGYTPERPGIRTMDRFPEPDEPAEWDHVCTITRSDTGAEIAYDYLPTPTQEVIDDAMLDAAEEAFLSARDEAAAQRADWDRDEAHDRALEEKP